MAALLALLLAACGATSGGSVAAPPSTPAAGATATAPAAFPVTIADGSGRQVQIEKAPQRIVSYMPSVTETLYALGAGNLIVGTDNFSDYPEEAKNKPKLGGLQVNLEALVALQPDLVIVAGAKPDFVTLLEPQHIPVLVVDYKDVSGTLSNIVLVGKAAGKAAEASKLVGDMRSRMEAVQAKAAGAKKVRVYYELDGTDPSQPYTVGPGSFIGDLLAMAGGANVAANATGQFPRVSAEAIVQANPELILVPVGQYTPASAGDPARFAQRPGWENVEAVKQQAIRTVDDSLMARPGPRLPDALDQLAKAVHPELFK